MRNEANVVHAFGFELDADHALQSIYLYAPVFRLTNADGEWIVKRTQKPLVHGQAIHQWTDFLARQGVNMVTTASGFGDNPRAFVDEEGQESVWVVRPFITGAIYQGDPVEIRAAGDLLGKIHAAGADIDFGLKMGETIRPVDADEIAQDVAGILHFVRQVLPAFAEEAEQLLQKRIQRYFQEATPRLAAIQLPLANCTWDYKASNLIYTDPTTPILIDPDNGGRIPRLYDLAIAALLFHNEGTGPARVFTATEWQHFLDGYRQHIHWTGLEKAYWDDILLCAWADEALWLLKNDDVGWAAPKQSAMLLSLLRTDLFNFALRE